MTLSAQAHTLVAAIGNNFESAMTAFHEGDTEALKALAFDTASMEIELEVLTRPLTVDWMQMN